MKASFRFSPPFRAAAAILPCCFTILSCGNSPKKEKTPDPIVVAERPPRPKVNYLFKISQAGAGTLSATFENQNSEPMSVPVDPAGGLQVMTKEGRLLDLVTPEHREIAMQGSYQQATKNLAPGEKIQTSITLAGRVDLLSGESYTPQQGDQVKAAWSNNQRGFVSNQIKLSGR